MKRSPIRKRRTKPRRNIVKDPAYLEFIAGFPCIVCIAMSLPQKTRTEVAHVGERGLGQKCSAYETLPISEYYHRTGPLALHKLGKKFWTHFGIDKAAQISHYQSLYEKTRGEQR